MSIKKTLYEILEIKKNKVIPKRWFFTSFSGHYSDNPKYLSIALHKINPSIEIIWSVKPAYKELLPDYVTYVEFGSATAIRYVASSDIIIDNVYGGRAVSVFGDSFIKKMKAKFIVWGLSKKNQRIYTTWHGTPLKKMGRDQIGNDISQFECCNIKMVLGNRFTTDIMQHLTFNKIPMKLLGTPRNDILFSHDEINMKKQLNLPNSKRIILFAPTFRNDGKDVEGKNLNRSGINQLNMIDIERLFRLLHDKFGGDWVLVCRFHYHVAEMVDWEGLSKKYDGRIINGNLHDDMAEYLACTDVLLTDASSCMFDYIITNKPCFLFFPDIDNYEKNERGFYLNTDQLPFPLATNFDELIKAISSFDNEAYLKDINDLKDELGYYEDGKSSERILEWIFKDAGY